jgi:hypothetical protein
MFESTLFSTACIEDLSVKSNAEKGGGHMKKGIAIDSV